MPSVETATRRPWLWPVVWTGLTVASVVGLLWLSPTAREVALDSSRSLFLILTTPFIMETMLALIGLCIVMMINLRRQAKETDEWVYLEQPEPRADDGTEIPPHRLDAVIWRDKPEAFDALGTELSVIEGYLSLGLDEEALAEFDSMVAAQPQNALKLAGTAAGIAEKLRQRRSGSSPTLPFRPWLERCARLDPHYLDKLAPDHPLRAS